MNKNGRKIDNHMENPIDDAILYLTDDICIYLNENYGSIVTPNILTTIGLMLGVLCVYFLLEKMYLLAFVFFWLTYLFDCIDGHYARKYDMITEFGDYYDHIRDIFIIFNIILVISIQLEDNYLRMIFLVMFAIQFFFMLLHMGCQENNYQMQNESPSLNMFKTLCFEKNLIQYTKFIGCGTAMLFLSLSILFLYIKPFI
jgi:phosphatidylglycerophosphate synthase